jgi:RNA polymerase sigma-70 factor (ECF subfamily)
MIHPDELAARARQDPSAFAALYDAYYTRVYNYLRYRIDDDATAEDLCAQVFERLLTHIGRYEPERGPFEPWLFAIARNALNDHWRRMKLRRFISLDSLWRQPATIEDPQQRAEQAEQLRSLQAALSTLDERMRDLVSLKFGAGLSNREIASATGLSESNVGVLLYRAVQKLRKATGGATPPAGRARRGANSSSSNPIEVDHE